MNERAGRVGPQRAPPSGLCGGLGVPTRAAAWAPRVRRACVRAGARRASGPVRVRAWRVPGPVRVRTPCGRMALGSVPGRRRPLFGGRWEAAGWARGPGAGQTPLGGGGGGWAVPFIRMGRSRVARSLRRVASRGFEEQGSLWGVGALPRNACPWAFPREAGLWGCVYFKSRSSPTLGQVPKPPPLSGGSWPLQSQDGGWRHLAWAR